MSEIALTARLAVSAVFLVSAVSKLRAFGATEAMVAGVLNAIGVRLRAVGPTWCLVAVELAAGFGSLPYQPAGTVGLIGAGVLLFGFSALAMAGWLGRVSVRCACFGRATIPLGARHLPRNATLLLLVGLALLIRPTGPAATGELLLAVGAAIVVAALAARYDDLVDLFGPTPGPVDGRN
jgi:hypothetical protein